MNELDKEKFPKWDNWLRVNAEKHYIEKNRRHTWKEVPGAQNPRNALSEQISIFYNGLPFEQQQLFRKGLASCLQNLPQQSNYIEIFLMLIQLCAECDCYEIVESNFFEKIIFKGKLGYLNERVENRYDNICIFYIVIQVLRHFSSYGNGKKITKIAKKMVSSPYFVKKHIYQVFLILCKAQPNKLFENWQIVRNTHFSFRASLPDNQKVYTAYPILQTELNKIINVQDIAEFNYKVKTLEDYHPEDEWLIHLLHKNNNGSVLIKQVEGIVFEQEGRVPHVAKARYPRRIGKGFIKVVSDKVPSIESLYENGEITTNSIINAYMTAKYDIGPETGNEPVSEFNLPAVNEISRQNEKCRSEGLMA